MTAAANRVADREAVDRVRAWLHKTALSSCPDGRSTCADWPLAAALVNLAAGEISEADAEALALAQTRGGPSNPQIWVTAAIFAIIALALSALAGLAAVLIL